MEGECPHCGGKTWAEAHHMDMGHVIYEPAHCDECGAYECDKDDLDPDAAFDVEVMVGWKLGEGFDPTTSAVNLFRDRKACNEVAAWRSRRKHTIRREREVQVKRDRYLDDACF